MARASVAATSRTDDGRRQQIMKVIFNVLTMPKKPVLPCGAMPLEKKKRRGNTSALHRVDRSDSKNETAAAIAPINGSSTKVLEIYTPDSKQSTKVQLRYLLCSAKYSIFVSIPNFLWPTKKIGGDVFWLRSCQNSCKKIMKAPRTTDYP